MSIGFKKQLHIYVMFDAFWQSCWAKCIRSGFNVIFIKNNNNNNKGLTSKPVHNIDQYANVLRLELRVRKKKLWLFSCFVLTAT